MVLVLGEVGVPWAKWCISATLAACQCAPSELQLRVPYSAISPVLGLNALPWSAVCLMWLAACNWGDQHGCCVEPVWIGVCVYGLHMVLQLLVGMVALSELSGIRCGLLGKVGMVGTVSRTTSMVGRTTIWSSGIKCGPCSGSGSSLELASMSGGVVRVTLRGAASIVMMAGTLRSGAVVTGTGGGAAFNLVVP